MMNLNRGTTTKIIRKHYEEYKKPFIFFNNYTELSTLLTLRESLVEGGFEPLTTSSMRNNLNKFLPHLLM